MVKARTRDAAKLLAELEERHNSVEEHLELRAREAELVWRTELLALQRAAAAAVGRAEAALGASPAEGLAAQVRSELDAVASAAASWRGEAAALQERVRRKARESVARAAELATPSAGDAAAEAEAEARRQVEACDARVRDLTARVAAAVEAAATGAEKDAAAVPTEVDDGGDDGEGGAAADVAAVREEASALRREEAAARRRVAAASRRAARGWRARRARGRLRRTRGPAPQRRGSVDGSARGDGRRRRWWRGGGGGHGGGRRRGGGGGAGGRDGDGAASAAPAARGRSGGGRGGGRDGGRGWRCGGGERKARRTRRGARGGGGGAARPRGGGDGGGVRRGGGGRRSRGGRRCGARSPRDGSPRTSLCGAAAARAAAAEERQQAVAAAAEAEAAAEAAEGALAERRRALRAEADVTAAMEADSADAAAAGPHRTAHTFRAAQKTPPVRDPSDALDAALSAAMHAASLPLRVGVRRLDERGACVFETMPGAGRAAGTPLRVQLALGPKGLLSARAAGGGAAVALSELWMAMCDEAPPAADGDDDERVGASVGRIAQLAERERVAAGAARRGAGRGDAAEQRWEQQHVGGGGRLRAEHQLRIVFEPALEAQPAARRR